MIILLDFALIPLGIVSLIVSYIILKMIHRRHRFDTQKNLLVLSPSGYNEVKARGTEHLATFDNDVFDAVYFVCPGGAVAYEVDLTPRMKMIDIPSPKWILWSQAKGFKFFSFLMKQAFFLFLLYNFVKDKHIAVIRSMEPHNMGFKGILLRKILKVGHIQDIRANFDLIFMGTGKSVLLKEPVL